MSKAATGRLILCLCLVTFFSLGTANAAAVDYSHPGNWAYRGNASGQVQAVDASMGRGIPMMLAMSDRMTYNSEGTELLLAWKLQTKCCSGDGVE